jgi:hypothetical protein
MLVDVLDRMGRPLQPQPWKHTAWSSGLAPQLVHAVPSSVCSVCDFMYCSYVLQVHVLFLYTASSCLVLVYCKANSCIVFKILEVHVLFLYAARCACILLMYCQFMCSTPTADLNVLFICTASSHTHVSRGGLGYPEHYPAYGNLMDVTLCCACWPHTVLCMLASHCAVHAGLTLCCACWPQAVEAAGSGSASLGRC